MGRGARTEGVYSVTADWPCLGGGGGGESKEGLAALLMDRTASSVSSVWPSVDISTLLLAPRLEALERSGGGRSEAEEAEGEFRE